LEDATAFIEQTVRLIDRTIRVQAERPSPPTPKSDDAGESSTLEPSDPLADLAASLIGELAPSSAETPEKPTVTD
jgi:hypothetical protein